MKPSPTPPNPKRRLAHLVAGLVLPGLSLLLPFHVFLPIAWAIAGILIAVEIARFASRRFNCLFNFLLKPILRTPEKTRTVAASTYLGLSSAIAFTIFPYPVALTAVCFSAVGDAAAGAAGERWGKTKVRGKSPEGSSAFLVASLAIGFLLAATITHSSTIAIIVGAVVAAVIEWAPLPVNDDLSVSLASGFAMAAVGWVT